MVNPTTTKKLIITFLALLGSICWLYIELKTSVKRFPKKVEIVLPSVGKTLRKLKPIVPIAFQKLDIP